MFCDSCRETLNRARDLYYRVEKKLIPLRPQSGSAGDYLIEDLKKITRAAELVRRPMELTFRESLALFFRRADVQWVVSAAVVVLAWKLFGRR